MSEDEAAAESGTVVEVAAESGEFPTLVAAIEAAGLVDTLQRARSVHGVRADRGSLR